MAMRSQYQVAEEADENCLSAHHVIGLPVPDGITRSSGDQIAQMAEECENRHLNFLSAWLVRIKD